MVIKMIFNVILESRSIGTKNPAGEGNVIPLHIGRERVRVRKKGKTPLEPLYKRWK
jgi:hypothetical protein